MSNLVVRTSSWREEGMPALFGDEPFELIDTMDLSQLAVKLGAFPGTTKARNAGWVGPIPYGWTTWKANKAEQGNDMEASHD